MSPSSIARRTVLKGLPPAFGSCSAAPGFLDLLAERLPVLPASCKILQDLGHAITRNQ